MCWPGQKLFFDSEKNMALAPFVIYADFESILKTPDDDNRAIRSSAYQEHQACSAGLKLVSIRPDKTKRYEMFFGEDVLDQFLNRLIELEDEIQHFFSEPVPMPNDPVAREDIEFRMRYVYICWICSQQFKAGEVKVC
jgi:hypothetical protein